MRILLKIMGTITTIAVVVLGASIIGSRNGVDIHNAGKNYSAEKAVAVSADEKSTDTETNITDYAALQVNNANKPSDEGAEEKNIETPSENIVEEEIPFVSSIDELLTLINKTAENLKKEFTVKLSPSLNMDTLLDEIPEDAIRHLTSVAYSAKIIGDDITAIFTLEYKDHFAVLRAYRDESLIPLLNGNEKSLLSKSKEIVAEMITSSMSDYEKEKAIHDYLVANFQYDNQVNTGNFTNLSYSGYGLLFNGIGVCDAYARIMYILANMAGVECLYVIGYAGGDTENYGHAWNKIKIDNEWYNVDATWDDPLPDEKGRILYDYFNVTDEFLSKDHTWNKEFYPVANTEK